MTVYRLRMLAFCAALLIVVSGRNAAFADSPTTTPNPTQKQAPTNAGVPVTINITGAVTSGTAGVQVLATYHYKNLGDRLYLSKDRTTNGFPVSVHVPLPIGAQAIAFNSPAASRFAVGGDPNAPVVQDTKPVIPGQTDQIVFPYQM